MATFSVMADVPNPLFDTNGDPFSGAVLKAFLPGTTTSTSIAIDSAGGSPQTSITANAQGKWEVSGNEILPYIDRKHKWGIFANATDAAANTPFYMGPFNNVERSLESTTSSIALDMSDEGIVTREFLTVAAMIADVALKVGDKARTLGYLLSTDGGGNTYEIVAAATGTVDGGEFIDLTGITGQAKGLFPGGVANIKQFGSVGDGAADDVLNIQAALDFISGGGSLLINAGIYAVSDTVTIGSDSIVNCVGTLKLTATTSTGGMVINKANVKNVYVYGINLDANNIAGENGVGLGTFGGTSIHFIGGSVKNCTHSKTTKGGRALAVQLGTTNAYKDILFTGFSIDSCYQAMDIHGTEAGPAFNVVFSDMQVRECELLFVGFSQGTTNPSPGDETSCVVSNIIANNVGKNITYDGRASTTNGAITFDRGSNIQMNNVYIHNTVAYGKIGGIFYGKCFDIDATSIKFDGTALAAVNGNTWDESDSTGPDANAVDGCTYEFTCVKPVDDIVIPEIGGATKMLDTIVRGVVEDVVSDNVLTPEMAGKPSCLMDIYNRNREAFVRASFNRVFPTSLLWSALANSRYEHISTNATIQLMKVTASSTGGGLGDGTSIGAQKADGTGGNVFLETPSGGTCAFTTNDAFQTQSSAFNGRHLAIGNFHLWVDATGDLRIKDGVPTSATDGVVVGTQT